MSIRTKRTMVCSLFLLFCLWCIPHAHAQNVLNLLSGADDDPALQKQGILSLESVKQRLKEVNKLIERPEGAKKQAEISKQLKELRDLLVKYQVPPKEPRFRRDKAILDKREEIVEEIKNVSSVLLKTQTAYGSIDQHYLELRTVLKMYITTRNELEKSLTKKYPIKKRHLLLRLIRRAQRRLKAEEKAIAKSSGDPKKLDAAIESNKQSLRKVREKMLAVAELRPRPRPRVAPRPTPPPTKAPRRRRRRRAKKPEQPPPLTASQLRKIELKRERTQIMERLNNASQRYQFQYLSQNAIYLRVRKSDVALGIEVHQNYASLYKYTIRQLQNVYDLYKAKAAGGRLHQQPLSFSFAMFAKVSSITASFLENSQEHATGIYTTASQKLETYQKQNGWILLVLFLLLPFLFLGVALFVRRWLRKFARRYVEGSDENDEGQQFWQFLLLATNVTQRLLLLTAVFLGLWLVIEIFKLPESWNALVWNIGWTIIVLRAIWILANKLFAEDPQERVLGVFNDELTRRFRRTIKWMSGYAVIYLPFLALIRVLNYPNEFYVLLDVSFYTVLWLGAVTSYLRSPPKPLEDEEEEADGIAIEEPSEAQGEKNMRRWSRILGYRVYPLLLILATSVFGVYVWGYHNLAAYLTQACLLTLFFVSITSSLYQGLKALVYRVFGLTSSGKGWIQVSPRTATIIKRSSRIVLGTILGFFTLSLIMQAWQVPGGYQAVIKLLNYPILEVKGARLSVLSILKFVIVFGASIWFSGYLKRQLGEKVYPVFHVTPGTQHASNTVLGYIVIIIGVLAGLQVMGMSIGVLAVFAGVVGIGVGFGLQNIASNFISGLIITFGRPVAVGDVIEVGDVYGIVRTISARSMNVETVDSRIVLVPNAQIITSQVINWSLGPPHVMIKMGVGVAYGSDVKLVEKTLLEVAKESPLTLAHPPAKVLFTEFNSSSLDFTLIVAVRDPMTKGGVLSELRFATDRRFAELGIEMPFPQQDLHLDDDVAEAFRKVSSYITTLEGKGNPAESLALPPVPTNNPSPAADEAKTPSPKDTLPAPPSKD